MPLPISDRKLASLYSTYQRQLQSQPNLKLGHEQVLKLLAEVGDTGASTSAKVLEQLQRPGLTREQQVALVQRGTTPEEKADLEAILDQGTVPLEPSAREFLSAVVGRATPTPPPASTGLQITGDQRSGVAGLTKPGASVEAINLSAAPSGRLRLEDTMEIAKADAHGAFSNAKLTGDQTIREGDLVRMRSRFADGTTSDWVTVKAKGVGPRDTRNAEVALFRIGMTDKGGGVIDVSNINASRQVSEPGATLQFTNSRTNEKSVVTITDKGGFPPGFTLKGKPGDSFAIAASDGVNNTSFATKVGNVTVPGATPTAGDLVPDPALHKNELNADGTPKFGKVRFTGPLFVDGIKAEDVQQGQLGDCYFPAALAAVAKVSPETIQKLIKDNGDGTYTVTFKERDWATNQFKDVPIKVDADLYVRAYGGALYGHSANSEDPKKMELWFPLVEKAYAQWRGDYNTIGSGGMVHDVFEAVTGHRGASSGIATVPSLKEEAWKQIKKSISEKTPIAAGTHGEDREALYTNTGVFADHGYSILGYEEQGGTRKVILRNPWGETEPAGNGANDGIFSLELDEFAKLYSTLMYIDDHQTEPAD